MVKKIAVLGAEALDEFIFVLPALQALRESFKDSEIVFIGTESHQEYLKDRPGPVDRVVIFPATTLDEENNTNAFLKSMQEEHFDIAFQLSNNIIESNEFIIKLGAKLTAGFITLNAQKLDISIPFIDDANLTNQCLQVVSRAGAKARFTEAKLAVTENDFIEAYRVLKNVGDKPIALIHPIVSDIRKQWPHDNFIKIANYLIYKGYHVCITDIDVEEQSSSHFLSHVINKEEIQHLPTDLSLAAITGLSSLANIVIGNDASALYVARALRTPTIGIFWCGNITNTLPPETTIHRNLRSWTSSCPVCGLSTLEFNHNDSVCKHNTSFVAEITTDEMEDTIDELLAQEKEDRDDEQITISA